MVTGVLDCLWLVPALPLLGVIVNGALALFVAAFAQAFFTLSIGMGALMAYGAYLPPDARVPSATLTVVVTNVVVSLLAGLTIFPLAFRHGIERMPPAGVCVMLETAICKIFCSDMGWRVVNDTMQIMGGESYMTENEVERVFPDRFRVRIDLRRPVLSVRDAEGTPLCLVERVRYADTAGFANDYERGNAWRYRDYVIDAFNQDKPYDRFLQEQLAGDELSDYWTATNSFSASEY